MTVEQIQAPAASRQAVPGATNKEPSNEMGGRAVNVENAKRGSALMALVRTKLAGFEELPPYEKDPDVYRDWGDDAEFSAKVGKGECSGP